MKLKEMNMGGSEEKAAGYSSKGQKVRDGMGVTKSKLDKEMGDAKSKDGGQYKEVNNIKKQAGRV